MSDFHSLGFPSPADALNWLVAMGADEIIIENPLNRFAESAVNATPKSAPPVARPGRPGVAAAAVTDSSLLNSIAELVQALNFLETHPLRKTANKLSFFEGPEQAEVLIIADHPRKEEDRSGLVFADKARILLANMLAAIDLRMEDVALMNLMPWRPLGGAAPRSADVAAVLPFARRAIELVKPRLILAFSGLPGHYLARSDASVQRQRGIWADVSGIPLLATLHPDELLRTPSLKRQAWRDLLIFKEKL